MMANSKNNHFANSTIELSVSCRNLRNRDLASRSDPYCVLYTRARPWNTFYDTELGRTEIIADCLSPAWTRKFTLEYRFSALQPLKFEVMDSDPGEEKEDDFLGLYETTLAELLARGPSRSVVVPLRSKILDGLDMGELIVVCEEVFPGGEDSRMIVKFDFSGEQLLKGTGGGSGSASGGGKVLGRLKASMKRNRTFLEVSRSNEDGSYSLVYRGKPAGPESKSGGGATIWKPVQLPLSRLCNGDPRRPVKIAVLKWKADGQHRLLGTLWSSLEELMRAEGSSSSSSSSSSIYPVLPGTSFKPITLKPNSRLYLERPSSSAEGTSASLTPTLLLRELSISDQAVPSFLDYISGGGTQLHFAVAIDFTASNGHPGDPRSLHRLSNFAQPEDQSTNPNQYEIALQAVGDIIAQYDSLKMYPAFGFGAALPPEFKDPARPTIEPLFHLNYTSTHPYCVNVASILEHYRQTVAAVRFTEPTRLAPVIAHTTAIADRYSTAAADAGKHYFVLLILTDGGVDDLPETVAAIVAASSRPMSIVIVGIGEGADGEGGGGFYTMQMLDGDDGYQLAVEEGSGGSGGGRIQKVAERDIVQFVPLKQFIGTDSSPAEVRREELAQEVLAEVPRQVVDYMVARGIRPKNRRRDSAEKKA